MTSASTAPTTGYAPVNGLQMYYEIHGEGGTPLVLLHGSFMTIELNWNELLPILSEHRQVIAVEMQAHGRTADIDRTPTLEHFADDVAALLDHLGIDRADILGYSLGGSIAIQVTTRHPERVRKLVVLSSPFRPDGWLPEVRAGIENLDPEMLASTPLGDAYRAVAPNPDGFAEIVERIKTVDLVSTGSSDDEIRNITAPVLLVTGDADGIRLEHTIEVFHLLGGGVFGDFAGVPPSRLAILPGQTHVGLMMQTEALARLVIPFLDEPVATKDYTFEAANGPVSLLDLFDGRSQLIVYHFMFGPDWDAGCDGCSMVADNVGHLAHLHARDVSFVMVSRAPLARLADYKSRMGWDLPWVSSYGSDFNDDFGATHDDEEDHGITVFLRDGDDIFRTWNTGNRGIEILLSTFTFLDMAPFGRQESWEESPAGWPQSPPYEWWRRHDEYEPS